MTKLKLIILLIILGIFIIFLIGIIYCFRNTPLSEEIKNCTNYCLLNSTNNYVPGELIVTFGKNLTTQEIVKKNLQIKMQIWEEVYTIKVKDGKECQKLCQLKEDPQIKNVELNYITKLF